MFVKMKGHTFLQGEIVKSYWKFVGVLKKTKLARKRKLVWKHPQVVGIHICSNQDPYGMDGTTSGRVGFKFS